MFRMTHERTFQDGGWVPREPAVIWWQEELCELHRCLVGDMWPGSGEEEELPLIGDWSILWWGGTAATWGQDDDDTVTLICLSNWVHIPGSDSLENESS